ncbi:HEXXH motif domain-containing protein [Streptomyces uncialis]|uniref:HEXXH motif domain-containing protein n=1 Tax=Streptomyces uncialis TaxID=1048205 RepID=UPI0038272341
MSGALFDRIASGEGGREAAVLLRRAEYSRRLMLVREVVARARDHSAPVAAAALTAWSLLSRVHGTAPDVAREVLTYPSVGPAQLRSLSVLVGATDAVPCADPLLATAVAGALRANLPVTVTLPVRHGRVLLPSLGAALFDGVPDGEPATVRVGPGGASVTAAGQRVRIPPDTGRPGPDPVSGTGWLGLRPLLTAPGRTPLLLDDIDPDAFPAAPGTGRLPAARWAHWRRTFADARRLLRAAHPGPLAETEATFRAVVPVLAPPGRDAAGSSDETFGCTGLSTPRDARDLALALVHELQHNKLAAVTHLFDLTSERPGEYFYAPWREDPRPLGGLLHGVYAHLGVALFWHRQSGAERTADGRRLAWVEFARWRDASREACGTLLASGRLAPVGARFAMGMADALDELGARSVPPVAAARAAALSRAHRGRWAARHSGGASRAGHPSAPASAPSASPDSSGGTRRS